jgi:hypothetical protein
MPPQGKVLTKDRPCRLQRPSTQQMGDTVIQFASCPHAAVQGFALVAGTKSWLRSEKHSLEKEAIDDSAR